MARGGVHTEVAKLLDRTITTNKRQLILIVIKK
jgi:hypothetical protein